LGAEIELCKIDPWSARAGIHAKVARWHIFKPKFQIWVNFAGHCNGTCWYIMGPFGIFYGNLAYNFRFGMLYQEKSGNPDPGTQKTSIKTFS
jgi:hypothetical protein